jgi:ABC-type transport system substrate-binding protein
MKPSLRYKRISLTLLTIIAASIGIAVLGCGSTETVVQTVVVEKRVEVAVPQTVVVEKEIMVEGERVVETVVVEKEVVVEGQTQIQTVVVEKERVVEVEKPVVQTVVVEREVEAPRRSGGEISVATVYVPPPLYLPSAQPSPEYWKLHVWGITETLLRTDRDAPPPAYGTPGTDGIGTGWEIDGDQITFTLREGVSFRGIDTDWGPLTAEDVVHSMTDAGKEGSRAARAPTFNEANGSGIWDCNAIDDTALTCTLNPERFHPDFFYLIANENGQLGIHSKRVFDELGEANAILEPHGSGPWRVVKHVGNDELVANAVMDHWRATPLADSLRIIEIREPSQAAAALATGEVHLAQIPSSLVLDTENRSRGRRVQINAGLGGQAIYFGGNFWTDRNHISDEPIEPRPGFKPDLPWIGEGPDDENANKVRRALSMALNRDLINKSILVGLGKPIYTHTGYEQSTPHWQDRWFVEYDPEGAKALLAEAGYPDGFEMGFWVPSDSPFVNPEVGVAIAGQWRDIGIDVQIENTAYSARRPTLVDRSIDIPWHFINSAEGGFFGNMYGRWRHGAGWNSGVEFPYDVMKDWDTRYLSFDRNTQGDEIIALNTEIEDYVQRVGVEIPVVELVKWYVLGPEVLDWKPYRHNENGPNSFETMLLDR